MGVNDHVRDMRRKELVMFVNLWDDFINDKSLFANDELHLNCIGKVRLDRVLDGAVD